MNQDNHQPTQPFTESLQSWTARPGSLDDWPNTVTVTATSGWSPNAEGLYPLDQDREHDGDYADQIDQRQLVEIDTNYKPTRSSEHPVLLTRTDTIHLAAHLLAAVDDTFRYNRVGRLRGVEAAALLRALPEVEDTLAGLRRHALDDLLYDTHPDDQDDEQEWATSPEPQAAAEDTEAGRVATQAPLALTIRQAIRDAFGTDTAAAIETDDAYGALEYRIRAHATARGSSPAAVLAELTTDQRAFASHADQPAAYLAAKIRDL